MHFLPLVRWVTLAILVVGANARAHQFFSPYSSSHWFAARESSPEFIEKAMEELRLRILLARERIAGAKPQLTQLSAQLKELEALWRSQGKTNTAAFYGAAAATVLELPERFQMARWLDEVETERVKFLEKSRALTVPELNDDGRNGLVAQAVQESRHRMYLDWHRVVEWKSGTLSRFFSPETLETQDKFNQALLKSALPLCDMGQIKPPGAHLVEIDVESAQFLHAGRRDYFMNYSFLFASISPEWPLPGDPASTTLLEFRPRDESPVRVEISHASPYFNLYKDSNVIAAMLDGEHTQMPLQISLVRMPWYRVFSNLEPRYNAKRHRLTTYYGTFKGDWGSTRWEPAASDFSCAKALRNSLTPQTPWNRSMTPDEMLAEILRAPK